MDQVKTFIPIIIVALILGCNSPKAGKRPAGTSEEIKSELKGNFSVCGAYALYPLISRLADEFMKIQPDIKIDRVEIPFVNLEEAHRSLWLGFYPDQLCRELTLGSLGKPTDPIIVGFLKFVLGEGQKNIKKSGFCPLNNVYISYSLDLLK